MTGDSDAMTGYDMSKKNSGSLPLGLSTDGLGGRKTNETGNSVYWKMMENA